MTRPGPNDPPPPSDPIEDKLARTFEQRASTIVLEPAPVAEILHRARRRRQRRHAAGIVAGAGALVLTSTVAASRAKGDGAVQVESNVASQGGTAADDVPASFGEDVPATADGKLLRLGIDLPQAQVANAYSSPEGAPAFVTVQSSHQRFRADPNDFNSASLDIATFSNPVALDVPAAAPPPSGPVQFLLENRNASFTPSADPTGGTLTWSLADGTAVTLTGRGLSRDELESIATHLVPRASGGYQVPPLGHGLVPVLDRTTPVHTVTSMIGYGLPNGSVTITTTDGGRDAFEEQTSITGHAPVTYRNVRGHRAAVQHENLLDGAFATIVPGTIVPATAVTIPSSQTLVEVSWYENGTTVNLQVFGTDLDVDHVLDHVVELDEATFQALVTRTRPPATTAPPPGDGSSSPQFDGTSSPQFDGTSSPQLAVPTTASPTTTAPASPATTAAAPSTTAPAPPPSGPQATTTSAPPVAPTSATTSVPYVP